MRFHGPNMLPRGLMETLKKPFLAPSLTVEASLEDVTLISGGGGNRQNNGNNGNHGNGNNGNNNNGNNGNRGT